jgi:hypothetical protein
MKIKNITISGGNQQFADAIINNNTHIKFDDMDSKLLALIDKYAASDSEKQDLSKKVVVANDPNAELAEKQNALDRIGKFIMKYHDVILNVLKTSAELLMNKYQVRL